MGEAKRRKQQLGSAYGAVNVGYQVERAWWHINSAVENAIGRNPDYLIIQCCNQDKGMHPDAITTLKRQMKTWRFPLNIPVLVQALPVGFEPSATKLFDGFITVWCNDHDHELWRHIFSTEVNKS